VILSAAAKKAKPVGKRPMGCEDIMQDNSAIPKFDLAEQIMAEQRRISSTKRKGPGRKVDTQKQLRKAEPTTSFSISPPILSEQQRIIAEIVSRDIKKLFAGEVSGSSGG